MPVVNDANSRSRKRKGNLRNRAQAPFISIPVDVGNGSALSARGPLRSLHNQQRGGARHMHLYARV